jgi:hypothetical protein
MEQKVVMVRETEECDSQNVERAEFWNSAKVDSTIRYMGMVQMTECVWSLMMIPGISIKGYRASENVEKQELVLAGVIDYTKANQEVSKRHFQIDRV